MSALKSLPSGVNVASKIGSNPASGGSLMKKLAMGYAATSSKKRAGVAPDTLIK